MLKLPKDANLRRQWVKFAQVKRADFVELTKHSVICNIFLWIVTKKVSYSRNGAEKAKSPPLSGAVPMIQSLAATNSAAKVLRILFTAQDGSANRTCFQENPGTNEEVDNRQCIKISYTKSTEN